MQAVIVDVHTHVFPPRMIAARAELATTDPGFAAIYADPAARMASAEDLLASMAEASVDMAVAAGFAWRSAIHAEEHATYILNAAAHADGRLLAFPPLPSLGGLTYSEDSDAGNSLNRHNTLRARLREFTDASARGVGELRFDTTVIPLSDEASASQARMLLQAARAEHLVLLVHSTEPVGPRYAGKAGGFTPGALWQLLSDEPKIDEPVTSVPTDSELSEYDPATPVIAAHWGGGLPFYAAMADVHTLFENEVLAIDTAATRYLYEPKIIEAILALGVGGSVLWGSDFPLRTQVEDRHEIEHAVTDPYVRAAILGGNATRLLRL